MKDTSSKKNTSKAPPQGVLARSSKLFGLAAGLAARELSGRLERAVSRGEELQRKVSQVKTQLEQAKKVVESLGRLKGAAMKAGQMLSIELRDYLPPEAVEILSQLQGGGQSVDFDEIRSILLHELGAEKFAQLRELSEEPIASASIGQVHSATIDDESGKSVKIVLKVQFRGIAESIDSDLAMLEKIARSLVAFSLKNVDLDGVMSELSEVLKQETDYLREAESLKRYGALAAGVSGLVVPRVYEKFSTKRVLALTFESGLSPDAWLKTEPSSEDRHHFGALILDLYFREFFDWGFVQTDPNFANFLFRPETGELVCLDFGATKEYSTEFRKLYSDLVIQAKAGRFEETLALGVQLGLINAREKEESRAEFYKLLEFIIRMFDETKQPFDFKDRGYVDSIRDQLFRFIRTLKHSPPPKQILFLHRKLGGIYHLLKALGVSADVTPYWKKMEATAARNAGTASGSAGSTARSAETVKGAKS